MLCKHVQFAMCVFFVVVVCFVFLFWCEGDCDGHGWQDHIVGVHWMDTVSQITFSNGSH